MPIPHTSPTLAAVFQVEHLTKSYGNPPTSLANDDISLSIAPGTIWGVLGPNGAGKTTLIRQMLGLLKPTSGRVLLHGTDIAGHPDLVPRKVGYLAQTGQALWDFTPDEALYFTGRLRGLGHNASRQEAACLIEAWQIGPFRRRVLRHLSGGQQRLVGLVSILMGAPHVLVLDEPTNHMDPAFRRLVWERLLQLNQRQQTTIVLVTHNVLEAETVVSQVAIIHQSRLLVQGEPARLKASLGEQRIHLDLTWHTPVPTAEALLTELGPTARRLDALRWRVTVAKEEADDVVRRLLAHASLRDLADLRLHSVSLEDYYLAMTLPNGDLPGSAT